MAKRIVFSADGTWQAPVNGTNVYKLYKMLTVAADHATFYDDGVGAGATGFDRMVGGAVGDGYTKIALLYEPGDLIFLFGFSEGLHGAQPCRLHRQLRSAAGQGP